MDEYWVGHRHLQSCGLVKENSLQTLLYKSLGFRRKLNWDSDTPHGNRAAAEIVVQKSEIQSEITEVGLGACRHFQTQAEKGHPRIDR